MDQCRRRSLERRNQMQSLSIHTREKCTSTGLPKSTKSCPSTRQKREDFVQSTKYCQRPCEDEKNSQNEPDGQNSTSRNAPVPTIEYFSRHDPFVSLIPQSSSPGKTYKICWNASLSTKIYKSTRCGKSIDIDFMVYYFPLPPYCISFPLAVAGNK